MVVAMLVPCACLAGMWWLSQSGEPAYELPRGGTTRIPGCCSFERGPDDHIRMIREDEARWAPDQRNVGVSGFCPGLATDGSPLRITPVQRGWVLTDRRTDAPSGACLFEYGASAPRMLSPGIER